jgi:hypothetical protein
MGAEENPLDSHPAIDIRFVWTHAFEAPGEDKTRKFVIPAM